MIEEIVPIPNDPAAERAVLAGVFRYALDGLLEVDDVVATETFADPAHRLIWRCLKHILVENQGAIPDLATIEVAASALGVSETLFKSGNKELLRGVKNFSQSVEKGNLRNLAFSIRKLHIARDLKGKFDVVAAQYDRLTGQEPLGEIIGLAESAIFDYASNLAGESDDPAGYGESAPEWVQHTIDNPVTQTGYPTGFGHYDEAIGGGIRRGGINVIASRTKGGKSWVADAMAINLAKGGVRSLILDTEMSQEKRVPRALASLSGVRLREEIETGRFTSRENEQAAKRAALELKKLPVDYKSVVGRSFDEITSMLRRWVVKRVGIDPTTNKANPCALLFDWFQLPDDSKLGKQAEHQAIGFQMKQLLQFLDRYGVACVAFVQMNRSGIQDESTAVVAQSDRIVHFCDSLSLFKWKDQEELAMEYSKPPNMPRYTHKMIAAVDGTARYGSGLGPTDFIHVETKLSVGLIREGPLNSKMDQANPSQYQSKEREQHQQPQPAGGIEF